MKKVTEAVKQNWIPDLIWIGSGIAVGLIIKLIVENI